jgi:hypothetical protein
MSDYGSNDPLKSTGNVFVNDYKKQDKQPDYTGYLDITREQIEALIKMGQSGEDVKLKLAVWVYPSKRNPEESRFFISAEPPQKKGGDTGGWGATKKSDTPF